MGRRKQDENGIVDVVFALWGWARVATPLQACVGGAIALVVLSFIIPALISALAADAPNTTAGPNVMVALAHFFSVVFALAGLFGGGGCFLIAASNAMSRDTGLPSEEVGGEADCNQGCGAYAPHPSIVCKLRHEPTIRQRLLPMHQMHSAGHR
jgi:hypothetical protein